MFSSHFFLPIILSREIFFFAWVDYLINLINWHGLVNFLKDKR
jgi:hypothetical protein